MRRMLDPKEAGGSTRHAYRIAINDFCWFLSFSKKDYGYEIGKETNIPKDFYTNDDYKDLLSKGYHVAGGYYDDLIVSYVFISTSFSIGGYKPSSTTTTSS